MKTKKVLALLSCMVLASSATACGMKPPMSQQTEDGKYNITIA